LDFRVDGQVIPDMLLYPIFTKIGTVTKNEDLTTDEHRFTQIRTKNKHFSAKPLKKAKNLCESVVRIVFSGWGGDYAPGGFAPRASRWTIRLLGGAAIMLLADL